MSDWVVLVSTGYFLGLDANHPSKPDHLSVTPENFAVQDSVEESSYLSFKLLRDFKYYSHCTVCGILRDIQYSILSICSQKLPIL